VLCSVCQPAAASPVNYALNRPWQELWRQLTQSQQHYSQNIDKPPLHHGQHSWSANVHLHTVHLHYTRSSENTNLQLFTHFLQDTGPVLGIDVGEWDDWRSPLSQRPARRWTDDILNWFNKDTRGTTMLKKEFSVISPKRFWGNFNIEDAGSTDSLSFKTGQCGYLPKFLVNFLVHTQWHLNGQLFNVT